jgi:hypothetical protein
MFTMNAKIIGINLAKDASLICILNRSSYIKFNYCVKRVSLRKEVGKSATTTIVGNQVFLIYLIDSVT